jgi:hypothetical protein
MLLLYKEVWDFMSMQSTYCYWLTVHFLGYLMMVINFVMPQVHLQNIFYLTESMCLHYIDQSVNAVWSENHMTYKSTLCGQNAEFSNVKAGGTYITTVPWRVKTAEVIYNTGNECEYKEQGGEPTD